MPKSEHSNEKKAASRNADLQESLKTWSISKYKFTTNSEIEKKRLEGDSDVYYWRDIPYYTNTPIAYHINYIVSADGDDVVFMFMGTKRLKPGTLKEIQTKIIDRGEKFKKQLSE